MTDRLLSSGRAARGALVAKAGGVLAAVLVVAAFFVWFAGTANPYTPAGYVGYVTRGAVFGKAEFVELQKGPTSTSRGWLLDVVNVSITPYSFEERFEGDSAVLTRDDLKISFRVHTIFRIDEAKVKEFVEKYSTLHESTDPNVVVETAYETFLKERLRTFARDEVEKVNGFDLKGQITAIGDRLFTRVRQLTDGTPFLVDAAVVGNIQYPEVVANAVAAKMAAQQKLEQMTTELEIERKKQEQRIVEAEGISKSMEIINAKLSPEYLQYVAIEAQKMMVGSPTNTVVYIPVGPMGVPIVGTVSLPGSAPAGPK